MKIALSILCENPRRPTGLSTLFPELVAHSRREFPDVNWLVLAGENQPWTMEDAGVEVVWGFPCNDRLLPRLWADHWRVGPAAAAHGATVLLTTGFVPRRAPLPVVMQVFTLHHASASHGGGWWRRWYRRRMVADGVRRARLVITNSQCAAQQLRAATALPESRLLVSPEGLDHARFHAGSVADEREALPRATGLPAGGVLWVSNFYPYKQAELLVAAYAALPAPVRAAHPLIMAGREWTDGRARARQLAARLGVAAQVHFPDRVDEQWLPALYRQAAVHALPSAEETFGRTVTEAMACGCPCLVNDIPALREVAGDAAECVDFRQTDAAAAALHRLLTDAPRTAALRERGLRRAAEFSYQRLVRERVGAIRACLESEA